MTPEFIAYPKIPRLFRDCIMTEKIDGTNAAVVVPEDPAAPLLAQSRQRFITPDDDNYKFAAWVRDHAEELRTLGPGRHFGEWWGHKINRGYGLTERRFSLFNVCRWNEHVWDFLQAQKTLRTPEELKKKFQSPPDCCRTVPVLSVGVFETGFVTDVLDHLAFWGSLAAPGYMNPEGLVVYHLAGHNLFKVTIGNDGAKGNQV